MNPGLHDYEIASGCVLMSGCTTPMLGYGPMTLALGFKGTDGVSLAVDSRLTSLRPQGDGELDVDATYDGAVKLLTFRRQLFIAAVTYGRAELGSRANPQPIDTYNADFNLRLPEERIEVKEFARLLRCFFLEHLKTTDIKCTEDLGFLVAGYDLGQPQGVLFRVEMTKPEPEELYPGSYGMATAGQRDVAEAILRGYSPSVIDWVKRYYFLIHPQADESECQRQRLGLNVDWRTMPVSNALKLQEFLIRATARIQRLAQAGNRGVGGAIHTAVIRRDEPCKIETARAGGRTGVARLGKA